MRVYGNSISEALVLPFLTAAESFDIPSVLKEANPIDTTFTADFGTTQPDSVAMESTSARNGDDAGALVQRLADGDPDALAEVYDRYAASLYRTLQALLCSAADAEDALQEVFVKIATGRTSRIRDLRSYLFVAARHEAFNILRRRKRESSLDDDSFALENMDAFSSPKERDAQPYDWTALLARLPLEQREVIALKVWEQMTFVEIARIVGVSPNTVTSRYRYGIERLRLWCREEDAHEH